MAAPHAVPRSQIGTKQLCGVWEENDEMTTYAEMNGLVEATPEDVGMSSRRLVVLTRVVQQYVDEGKLAGAITVVARHGRVAHFQLYGDMDAEAHKPMAADAIFRMASMTKPIASVALMSLYEEGHFQLETPVADFIPAFSGSGVFVSRNAGIVSTRPPTRPITVRDVLTHTAGFDGLQGGTDVTDSYKAAGIAGLDGAAPATGTLAERADLLARLPLVSDPGQRFTYHYGTDIVGRLCEVISEKPLDRFLQERVFGPLGMRDTSFHVPAAKRGRLAANYQQADGDGPQYRRQDPRTDARYAEDATFLSAGAGLVSTAGDYVQFAKMLTGGGELGSERIVGRRTLRFMSANHLPGGRDLEEMGRAHSPTSTSRGTGFGLGFAVLLDPANAGILGTPGEYNWGGAFSTAFFISPADDLAVLFLTQLGGSTHHIRQQLRIAAYQAIDD